MRRLLLLCLTSLLACERGSSQQTATSSLDSTSYYQYRKAANDGTGKVYMGREIAQVMGHLGAEWLERPEREQEERTDLLVQALTLKSTDVVADIGAGTGYFTFRMAPTIPKGKVLAVDIQQEMIDFLNQTKRKHNVLNVEPILGTITDPKLPENGVDLVLLVDAYHEFSHPREMMTKIVNALKTDGRLVLVEYRAEDPAVPIKVLHKMSLAQATKEMRAVGLKLLRNDRRLPQQHIMIFTK